MKMFVFVTISAVTTLLAAQAIYDESRLATQYNQDMMKLGHIVNDLLQNQEQLRSRLNRQDGIIADQKKTIDRLHETIKETERNLSDGIIADQKKTIDRLHETIKETERNLSDLKGVQNDLRMQLLVRDADITKLQAKYNSMQTKIIGLESMQSSLRTTFTSQLSSGKSDISYLKANYSSMQDKINDLKVIGFTADLGDNVITSPNENDILVFSHIMKNKGNAYNETTGKFHAPVSGYYVFYYSITTTQGKHLKVYLGTSNTSRLSIILIDSARDNKARGSDLTVVWLKKGQEIWLRVGNSASYGTVINLGYHCTFSGFLLNGFY